MAGRAVWGMFLAVVPGSIRLTLGSNQPLNDERQGRADSHDEDDAVEHLGVDETVEVAGGDEAHDGYRQVSRGSGELQAGDLPA